MINAIRRVLGIEKFEMPREPVEFTYIRPVIESHISGDWCMGKTPERTAIVVQLGGRTVPPLLKQQLKELADYHGFEIEVETQSLRTDTPIGNEVGRAGEGKPTDEPIHPGSEVRSLESTAKRDENG